jgi:hypothetical protein
MPASFGDMVHEVDECLAFLLQVVGGEGDEFVSVSGMLDEAEQVLDAPLPCRRVLPESSGPSRFRPNA